MKKLSVHTLMHVPYEGLGCIEDWINSKGHSLSYTKFFESYNLPKVDDIDALIVMGGPMSVYEEDNFKWLAQEKAFIREAVEKGKIVLGICLGSQLIAEVLGAKVYPNNQKEIGWFEVNQTKAGKQNAILNNIEDKFTVFHWHGDTYDLPPATEHLFYTNICKNQAFIFKNRVLGLQFHFEVTEKTLKEMVENGREELNCNETIQPEAEIIGNKAHIEKNNFKMSQILDNLFNQN